MSRLSDRYGEICVNDLLGALLKSRAEVEDGDGPVQSLCAKIESHSNSSSSGVLTLSRQLFREWPKFSGCVTFPVPGRGTGEEDEIVAENYLSRYTVHGEELDFNNQIAVAYCYFNAVDDGKLHAGCLWTGLYGDLRRELMQFMIDELQKEAVL
jgi:hypothetical protein